MDKLLDSVNSPADIKGLSIEQLRQLCAEIREYMVDCCSRNPGHLGASLGAVELIVGVHYVFDTPSDKLVFDVGHQAYAHKIITGRREAFARARTKGGISGFPKMSESPYDAFGAGHASTSISAALGFAEAAKLRGTNERAIAFIGDGALTGGLAMEGLNNAGNSGSDLLIILNDNNQSIDRNLGGLHNYLMKITTGRHYISFKKFVWDTLGESKSRGRVQRWWRSLKSWAVKSTGGDFFEALGMRYFGPIDGNDIESVVTALRRLKDLKGPIVLHAFTVKGKGYAPAEADPSAWHAPGRFDAATGERIKVQYPADRFQDVFGQVLLDLARIDSRVVGITPAMASGCGMSLLAEQMPERFFDVGIEEEHAVTFAAGLAAGGMRPFCNIYSAFAQRAYDQIIHDLALQKLPVVLCMDRAGLVGEDGATHNGVFDMTACRSIPGVTIAVPRDEMQLKNAMYNALSLAEGPYIIRYPRGCGRGVQWRDVPPVEIVPGKGECLLEAPSGHFTKRIGILALGPCAYEALQAAERLNSEGKAAVSVYDLHFLKPLDEELVKELADQSDCILTVEDGCLKGGLYGAVCETLAGEVKVVGAGVPDQFIDHASQKDQRSSCGIDAPGIEKTLRLLAGE